ncbi:MAG: DNA circularization N-terminal domain-containing protein [Nitrosomonadaceae bacterium]
MALLDELFPASYKGAPFLVNQVSTSGGRKTVLHEFPNSNIQVIEDLGLSPREYRISAIIAEPGYIQKRNTLLRALEGEGKGILIHPFYGRIENIVARTFTLNEDVSRLGDTVVEIVFGPSETDGLPTQSVNTVSRVSSLSNTVSGNIVSDITDLFTVTKAFQGNFSAAATKLNDIADAFNVNAQLPTVSSNQINTFNSLVDNFKSSINTLIGNPSELADDIQEIFIEFPKLYTTATQQTDSLALFFDFGDSDIVINPTTAGLVERKQNNDVLNNAMKGFALAEAYVSSAQIDFSTVNEVENTADTLELAFQSIKLASGLG